MRVAVIGAGVVGLATALELRRRGAEVVVLERAEPGAGASSGNAGWITPVFATPLPGPGVIATSLRWMLRPDSPLFIRPRPDLALIRWLWTFWRRSNETDFERGTQAYAGFSAHAMRDFDALVTQGLRLQIDSRGSLFLFTTGAGADHLRHEVNLMREFGYGPAEILSRASAHDLEPMTTPAVAGAILVPQERFVRPEAFVSALTDASRAAGVEIRTGISARLEPRQRRVAVWAGAESVEADEVVVAAGAWSRSLVEAVGVPLPVEAGRGYAVTVDRPSTNLRRATYLAESRIACTPFEGALRFAGTMEFSGLDAPPASRRFEAVRHGASQYLAGWHGTAEALWSGPRPVTPDGLPVVGRAGRYTNLTIATGHAMLGLTLAPSTGIAVADILCDGRSRYDIAAFAPDRFA
jgi:D-amino-acid dehydrogenase